MTACGGMPRCGGDPPGAGSVAAALACRLGELAAAVSALGALERSWHRAFGGGTPAAARAERCERKRLAAMAEAARDAVLELVGGPGPLAMLEAGPVAVPVEVDASVLQRLCEPESLSADLTLSELAGVLRPGWQLVGGEDLSPAVPRPCVVSLRERAEVMRLLRRLAVGGAPCWLQVRAPPLEAASHLLLQFDAWGNRRELIEAETQLADRWRAKEQLLVSAQREEGRLDAAGVGAALRATSAAAGSAKLRPAHLERRVHWASYREAERAVRRVARRQAAGSGSAAVGREAATTGAC